MPLQKTKEIEKERTIAVWQITEELDFFKKQLTPDATELKQISLLKHSRMRKEWYATRYLLHKLSKQKKRMPVYKDRCGKPYIHGDKRSISISHTKNFVCAMIDDKPCGIDIQTIEERIIAIAPRFMSKTELQGIESVDDPLGYHLYWGAKEASYKAYGKKGLHFIEHILLEPFVKKGSYYISRASIKKGDFSVHYFIKAFQLKNTVVVFADQTNQI